jgi:UrcA family protein
MYTNKAFMSPWPVVGTAIIACALLAGEAVAKDVQVAYKVSTQGLDLTQRSGALELYVRLERAARVVCTHGMRVDLAPSPSPQGCYEKVLGQAVGSVNLRPLTQVYLQTHTLREAAAHGIDVSVQMAAE